MTTTTTWHEITWDAMSQDRRLEIAMRAGWRTNKNTPSPTARRLSKTEWEAIPPLTRKTLINHGTP